VTTSTILYSSRMFWATASVAMLSDMPSGWHFSNSSCRAKDMHAFQVITKPSDLHTLSFLFLGRGSYVYFVRLTTTRAPS
jgi:hypothetical protein